MSTGYTFDEVTRQKLATAVRKYEANPDNRAPLNGFIMEIQQPYIDTIRQLQAENDDLKAENKRLSFHVQ